MPRPLSLPFWTPRELVTGLITAVLGALSNTSMSYLSVSRWRDGHGHSKYLLFLSCPVRLNADVRVFIVQLQGKLPVLLGISHQNHGPQTTGQTLLFEKDLITLNLQPRRSDSTAVTKLWQGKRRQTWWLPCRVGDGECLPWAWLGVAVSRSLMRI